MLLGKSSKWQRARRTGNDVCGACGTDEAAGRRQPANETGRQVQRPAARTRPRHRGHALSQPQNQNQAPAARPPGHQRTAVVARAAPVPRWGNPREKPRSHRDRPAWRGPIRPRSPAPPRSDRGTLRRPTIRPFPARRPRGKRSATSESRAAERWVAACLPAPESPFHETIKPRLPAEPVAQGPPNHSEPEREQRRRRRRQQRRAEEKGNRARRWATARSRSTP